MHLRFLRYPLALTSVLCFQAGMAATPAPSVAPADFIYTVQAGDHPWNLAQRYLRSPGLAIKLRQLNRIGDEQHIAPGTKLRIPTDWLKLESAKVQVLAVTGDTTVQPANAPARNAVAGEYLDSPAGLRTGATGSASLLFADGSRVLVRRDSQLELRASQRRSLSNGSIIEMALLQGSLENQVTPIGDSGGRFEIRTPAAVAAVRGTQFRVVAEHAAQGDALRTEVITGAVNVANAQGQVTAQALQGNVAQGGQTPDLPTPLLPAPTLDSLPPTIERLPIDWPFTAVTGAKAYRTQLAPGDSFVVAASDESSSSARIRARDVEDGHYVIRVRAVDAKGLEGQTAERAIIVHTQPPPPLQIEPAPDAATTAERPMLRWSQATSELRYRVQTTLAGALVDEQVVSSATAQPAANLAPGVYQWRVAAIHPTKGQGPWGDAQAFRRVLPGPDVVIPTPKDGSLTLRWPAQPQVANYRLQVSTDDSFAKPQTDVQSEAAQQDLHDLAPGRYFVRVQAIATDGYTGPWGGTQFFDVPKPQPKLWPALLLLLPAL